MNNEIEQDYWTLGKAVDFLKENRGIEIKLVTLRSWFNELEKNKVHTLPRTENKRERVLTKNDLEIAAFIYGMKEQYGRKISNEFIAEKVQEKFETNYNETEESSVDISYSSESIEELFKKLEYEMNERIEEIKEELKEEIRQEIEEENKLALPDPEQKRKEELIAKRTMELSIIETERRVKRQLRKEALEKWNVKPVMTGIIFKKEDHALKMEFIENYIDEHIDERLKAEYTLD